MFLIACQKETVKERGLMWYLIPYIHLEAAEEVCRGCCCRCLTQRELLCSLQSPWGTSDHPQISSQVQHKHLFSCYVEPFEETSVKSEMSFRDREVMRG